MVKDGPDVVGFYVCFSFFAALRSLDAAVEAATVAQEYFQVRAAPIISERFFHTQALSYDCRTGTCNPVQQVDNTGVLGVFNSLATDTYTVDVEMDNGQILTVVRDVPAPVLIPYVSSAVMNSQYNISGDLELSWTNPTGQANWGEVDELVIVLVDDVGNEVLYAKLAPTEESFTIPAALVAQAATIAGGTAVDRWRVRTVARDATDLVFSGGFSTLANLP